jgi:hypothetical protein
MCMWGATRLEASRENKEPEGGVGELEAVTSRASETRERETGPLFFLFFFFFFFFFLSVSARIVWLFPSCILRRLPPFRRRRHLQLSLSPRLALLPTALLVVVRPRDLSLCTRRRGGSCTPSSCDPHGG